jgi:hypothetical protein
MPATESPQAPFLDINQDGEVSPLDALMIFNHLNTLPPTTPQSPADGGDLGEGEGSSATNADAFFAALGSDPLPGPLGGSNRRR